LENENTIFSPFSAWVGFGQSSLLDPIHHKREDGKMLRTLSATAVAGLVVLMSMDLRAGGPPLLCLPVDGVTEANTAECTARLAKGLGDTLWTRTPPAATRLEKHDGQWYALLYLSGQRDVKLSDIDDALKGSDFSVPRGVLHFVGQVQLEVDLPVSAQEAVLKDLSAIDRVEVEQVSRTPKGMLVTLVLAESDRRDVFQLLKPPSTNSSESTSTLTAASLPSYAALCELMSRHDARLNDVAWSARWACSTFGSLAVAAR
jgi:hypothetical protein